MRVLCESLCHTEGVGELCDICLFCSLSESFCLRCLSGATETMFAPLCLWTGTKFITTIIMCRGHCSLRVFSPLSEVRKGFVPPSSIDASDYCSFFSYPVSLGENFALYCYFHCVFLLCKPVLDVRCTACDPCFVLSVSPVTTENSQVIFFTPFLETEYL